jgi:hypothetical protein
VAREIVNNRVDLVGLQEATIVRTGPLLPRKSSTALETRRCLSYLSAISNVDPTFEVYQNFIRAGFKDAWNRAPDPGFTCCQAANLRNPISQLTQRFDLVPGGFYIR